MMRHYLHILIGISIGLAALAVQAARLTLATDHLFLELNDQGSLVKLVDRQSGTNYLAVGQPASLLTVRTSHGLSIPDAMQWNEAKGNLTLRYDKPGVTVTLRSEAKPTHLVFELTSVEPAGKVDLVIWGPYPTTIGAIVGETVGVVRNRQFAIGIQSLNPKTLGGYPSNEDDIMPSYNSFAGSDFSDVAPAQRDQELFRGDTAKPTSFGSVLQAYCRDRHRDRVIANWGFTHFLAPAYNDGGVVGSRIALFGCPTSEALETIGKIEVAEGLPHPIIDGVWGKVSPEATASYLIIGFSEANLDGAIDLTLEAGLHYLYHDGPFSTWGHFQLHANQFPHGWSSLKRCVERAEKRGVRLGVHTLSNFITPNDPYVTPIPDPRLAEIGASESTADIDSKQTEIPVKDPVWFSQMNRTTLKTVMVATELAQGGGLSESAPWRLLDCQRGAWGTSASAHARGEKIAMLLDHPYRVFLTDASLSQEVARRIADLFNETGLLQISFDGLEGNWSTGMGQYGRTLFTKAWFDHLSPALQGRVINDASNPGHFNWHIYTRMNWGEPWYAGFRESQTQYRLKNQNYYSRNLMPHMLGWFQMSAETSLEDVQWLLARAAGFDAGFCLVTSPGTVRQNGLGDAILRSIKEWETARMSGAFPAEMKAALQDIHREFVLQPDGEKAWDVSPVYSFRLTNKRQEQPGMPTAATGELENPYAAQPLQFILQIADKAEADRVFIEIGGKEALALASPIADGQIVKYTGGETAVKYDKHWNRLGTLPVAMNRFEIPSGKSKVSIGCHFTQGDKSSLKCEFRTIGPPKRI
ncbi:MAG: hypothetical protein M1608_06705 [Candidatus Omnitrophica bacterium]|nr:hypothetical protein [Candidatus Omnitrophota bacterium]